MNWKQTLLLLVINLVIVMVIQSVRNKQLFGFIFEDETLASQNVALRFDWSDIPPITEMGKRIQVSQSAARCSVDSTNAIKFEMHQMIRGGLGEGIHGWSQSLCNAMEQNAILLTRGEWGWTLPTSSIPFDADVNYSPLWAFFGHHESSGACHHIPSHGDSRVVSVSDAWVAPDHACPSIMDISDKPTVSSFRAAAMEWLFSIVNDNVIVEAKKMIHRSFGEEGLPNADDLITLHLAEGNIAKGTTIADYVSKVRVLLYMRGKDGEQDPANIYLISDTAEQAEAFRGLAPENWKIYQTQPIYEAARPDRASGKAGLQALASILVALEANNFLLTTGSNVSRLINELRKNVVDTRCNKCTFFIDLHFGEW